MTIINNLEQQTVDEVIALEEELEASNWYIAYVSQTLDDMYFTPDRAWLERWLEDEIERADAIKEMLNRG